MKDGPISPKLHGLIDYALVASLITLPTALGLSKTVRRIYAAEAAALLLYVATTDHPVGVVPLIPFRTHGKIDPGAVGASRFAFRCGLASADTGDIT